MQLDHQLAVLFRDAYTLVGIIGAEHDGFETVGRAARGHAAHTVAALGGGAHQAREIVAGHADLAKGVVELDQNRSLLYCTRGASARWNPLYYTPQRPDCTGFARVYFFFACTYGNRCSLFVSHMVE